MNKAQEVAPGPGVLTGFRLEAELGTRHGSDKPTPAPRQGLRHGPPRPLQVSLLLAQRSPGGQGPWAPLSNPQDPTTLMPPQRCPTEPQRARLATFQWSLKVTTSPEVSTPRAHCLDCRHYPPPSLVGPRGAPPETCKQERPGPAPRAAHPCAVRRCPHSRPCRHGPRGQQPRPNHSPSSNGSRWSARGQRLPHFHSGQATESKHSPATHTGCPF